MNKKTCRALIVLFMHLEQMEKSGVPIRTAIATARDDTDERALKRALGIILQQIENGRTLSEALEMFPSLFNETLVRLVAVGEKTGRMSLVLDRCVDYLRRVEEHNFQMRRATRGPKISGFILLMLAIFRHENALPLLVISMFATVALILLLRRVLPPFRKLSDELVLHVPRLGTLMAQHSFARFAESLSLLFEAGVDLKSALEAAIDSIPNLAIRASVEKAVARVRGGMSLYAAFITVKNMDTLALTMLKTGEDSGNLSATLNELSDYYDKQTQNALTALQQVTEPLLSAVTGGILWFGF